MFCAATDKLLTLSMIKSIFWLKIIIINKVNNLSDLKIFLPELFHIFNIWNGGTLLDFFQWIYFLAELQFKFLPIYAPHKEANTFLSFEDGRISGQKKNNISIVDKANISPDATGNLLLKVSMDAFVIIFGLSIRIFVVNINGPLY